MNSKSNQMIIIVRAVTLKFKDWTRVFKSIGFTVKLYLHLYIVRLETNALMHICLSRLEKIKLIYRFIRLFCVSVWQFVLVESVGLSRKWFTRCKFSFAHLITCSQRNEFTFWLMIFIYWNIWTSEDLSSV